jgi:hypothetical protein
MKKGIIVITFLFILCNRSLAQQSIHHLVLFKLKPGISKEDQRFVKAVKMLDALPVEIPEIQDFRAGLNFSERPIAVDYGLMVLLSDEKSLKKYIEHPAHQAVAGAWREIADWNIVDFWAPVVKSAR